MAAGVPLGWRVGVEEERFVLVDGRAPATAEFRALITELARRGGYAVAEVGTTAGPLLEARRETPTGRVTVKHDYGTHLVEVAYPPVSTRDELVALYAEVWDGLRPAAEATGVDFLDTSYLADLPAGYVYAEHDMYAARTERLIGRPLPPAPLAAPHFLAHLAATQVTIEVDPEWLVAHLPAAYSLLYLVPSTFSRPQQVGGRSYRAARPPAYRDNLPHHPLAGVPRELPSTLADYRRTQADVPLGLRDYSFFSIRDNGLVEVRVGDALPTAGAVADLVALVLGLVRYAADAAPSAAPADEFYRFCEDGTLPDRAREDLAAMSEAIDALPLAWRPPVPVLAEGAVR
ncbi:hypothetical protein [Nocardioides speluncae]|uniref:hypothetical protein n=1 Tax=Nocardioides speluncae TaxID=2670337 RepID=UPI00137B7455|nr:hypothetical protein [Nocardioides speluncae]